YGGEEFVVVAPDCDLDGAIAMAERFRGEIADLRISFRNHPIKATCSVGVAPAFDPSQSEPLGVLDQADQALFQCKDAGRNAVWVWSSTHGGPVPHHRLRPDEEPPGEDCGVRGEQPLEAECG